MNIKEYPQKLFGKDRLYLLTPNSYQMMGYVLNSNGRIMVVDGGAPLDADELEEIIILQGGVVHLWVITHLHQDHIGAVLEVLRRGNVKVEKVICETPSYEYIKKTIYTDWEIQMTYDFNNVLNELNVYQDYFLYEYKDYNGFEIMFLKGGNEILTENFNDTSLVFRVKTDGEDILFLGDLGVEGGKYLLSKIDNTSLIECNVVQMAHHGQSGVDEEFYKKTKLKYGLWSTPLWLWENDAGNGKGTGPYTTLLTREWMKKMEVINIISFDIPLII